MGGLDFNRVRARSDAGIPWTALTCCPEGKALEYDDLLRRLSLHDERVISELGVAASADLRMSGSGLDPKTLALVRLAALVTIGGSVPSYGAHVDAAVGAGASAWEIVDVLLGVVPVVGLPRVVTAAPQLALALGHDVEDDFGSLPQG